MKKWLSTLPLLLAVSLLSAQAFNTILRDQLTYTQSLNDVWGYVAPDGTEYALVGTRTGFSIVSLADPDDISEVAFIGGDNSTWRDIKTYGEYAYVVADSGDDGLLIVDLSNLPTSVSHQYFNTPISGGTLTQSHNIFIDTLNGLAYLAGSNRNSGGMVLLDIATVPGQATSRALAPNTYSHDVFVQNGLMYASEIGVGRLNIYDVSDIDDITSIGTRVTPNSFTHNAWSNADDSVVFTTDERADAPVAAYDISDPSNPILLSEFRPARSLGAGTIPHNAHVLGDYVVTSYYTDGLEVVDASVPENPIEIAYYDTWSGADGGFNGTWGAYPFLPSGLVLATDISNGLFVIEVDYQLAARIKGTVTEESFAGDALNGVNVSITDPSGATTTTNLAGFYQSGFPSSGIYTITFSSPGYLDVITNLDFVQGTEIVLDTFLAIDVNAQSMVNGSVTNTATNGAVDDAQVILDGPDAVYTDNSNASGQLAFGFVLEDTYTASSGKWGFENRQTTFSITGPSSLNFPLTPGYLDGFVVDQGWTTSASLGTTSGFWERAIPVGTSLSGADSNPGNDASGSTDIGSHAYVTGNGGGTAGADDIDGGSVILTSPAIDFSIFTDPNLVVISYDYWFFNAGGSSAPNDQMTVAITNGSATETIATYTNSGSSWTNVNFLLRDLSIPLTPTMQLVITISDTGVGHVVEGGFDDFRIYVDPALPVELTAFTARKQSKESALLNWTTASESGNRGFAVERGNDGRSFSSIGFVDGSVDSQTEISYQFIDSDPVSGLNYYRLRQVDVDGTTAYSEVRSLDFTATVSGDKVTLSPNPASNQLWIDGINSDDEISIYSTDGRLLQHFNSAPGNRIDISNLPSGTYVLKVANEVARFVKE